MSPAQIRETRRRWRTLSDVHSRPAAARQLELHRVQMARTALRRAGVRPGVTSAESNLSQNGYGTHTHTHKMNGVDRVGPGGATSTENATTARATARATATATVACERAGVEAPSRKGDPNRDGSRSTTHTQTHTHTQDDWSGQSGARSRQQKRR